MSAPTDLLPRLELRVRLITKKGPRPRRTHALEGALTVMGSDAGCDVVLKADGIDAAHIAIVKLGGCAYVYDLGSPHGTKLNGRRQRWGRLTTGDQIVIGPYKFNVQVESSGQEFLEEEPAFRLRAPEDCSGDGASESIFKSRHSALIVGSDPACDLVANGDDVAPRHCLVIWTEDGPIIRSLCRSKALRLNGQPIEENYLLDGDVIGVGGHTFRFETEIDPAEPETLNVMDDDALFLAHIGAVDPSSIIAGRLDMSGGGLHRLWVDRPDAKRRDEFGGKWPSINKKSFLRTEVKETSMPNTTSVDKFDLPAGLELRGDSLEIETEDVNARAAEIQMRVAAAQRALDERARKYREGLDLEHERLNARQSELERQAQALREATLRGDEKSGEPVSGSSDEFAESGDATVCPSASIGINDLMVDDAPASKLNQRVAELVALAKTEQEEVKQGEITIESLRIETQRLRASVARRLEKIQARKNSLDERFKSLTSGLEILRNQREPLIARLRKLDAEEASIRSRLEEGGRIRGELAQDAEALYRAQERLKSRQQELLTILEHERLRVKQRQADMQRKATELEQVLHGRLGDIEDEMNARKAELEASIYDFSSFGVAAGEASRESREPDDSPPLDVSDQVEALGRVEQRVTKGAGRLDALRKKISALGSTQTARSEVPQMGGVDQDGRDAGDRTSVVAGNGRTIASTRAEQKADQWMNDIGDGSRPLDRSEKAVK